MSIDHLIFNGKKWRNFDDSKLIGTHTIAGYADAGGTQSTFVFSITPDGKIKVDTSKSNVDSYPIAEGTLRLDGKVIN